MTVEDQNSNSKPVAKGLGKRRAPAVNNTEDSKIQKTEEETGTESYFPIMEAQDDIEQVSMMLAFAEGSLDDPAQCRPLLRAVVHECDRIGKIKEILDEGEKGEVTLAEMELDADVIESFRNLVVSDELYRVMAEGLFRLAQVEDGHQKDALMEAALERLQTGLELFPTSTALKASLERLSIIKKLSADPENVTVDAFIDALNMDASNMERNLTRVIEVCELLSEADLTDLKLELEETLLKMMRPAVESMAQESQLAIAKLLLDSLESLAEADDYLEILQRMSECRPVLFKNASISDESSNDSCIQITQLTLKARYHIWEGCIWDMEEDFNDDDICLPYKFDGGILIPSSASAQESYQTAIAIHERLLEEHQIEIPEEVMALQEQEPEQDN